MSKSDNLPDQALDNNIEATKDSALDWDKRLLLSFIATLTLLFIVLNREANSFFPDARLYPYVMTVIGLAIAAFSVYRVLMGKEPNKDAQNGKEWSLSAEGTRHGYKKTIIYLAMFSSFYLGIWIVGFRVAAIVFVLVFFRSFGHNYRWSTVYALTGLLLVEGLSRVLGLVLPPGLLYSFLPF